LREGLTELRLTGAPLLSVIVVMVWPVRNRS
jgi:hypothetical protein